MNKFYKSKIFITLVIITVVVGILMAVSTIGDKSTNPVANVMGFITTPVSGVFNKVGNGISGFFTEIWTYKEYKPRYEQLLAENKELRQSITEFDMMKAENERLRTLLELKNSGGTGKKIAAEVVSVNPTNWFEDVIINKGKNEGITIGSTVINSDGLVGRVSEVGENWSKVITLLDTVSSAGCIISRTGDVGVLEGDLSLADTGECAMNYIAKDAAIAVGDSVVTSSVSSIYPQGIIIGKVSAVMPDSQGFYNNATVKTAVDFRKLKEVIVIVNGEK